ncbi:hypothetical protein ACIBG0_22830 [Nocardia sp. NPDC050630]|uniref:hypothetical protein n=1 Tax=Nocardia sp. NPDC050630 TaxID=3364321 RepID=UPI0037B4D95E
MASFIDAQAPSVMCVRCKCRRSTIGASENANKSNSVPASPAYGEMFRASAAASPDNSVMFPFEVFCAAFMQDVSPETQKLVYPLLERQPFHTMNESLDLDEWERLQLPSSYVLSKDDLALPPGEFAWAPRFPARLPGAPLIYTPGSHESLLIQPEPLAEALIQAAAA